MEKMPHAIKPRTSKPTTKLATKAKEDFSFSTSLCDEF
jgi:hypothetical protein